MVFKTWWCKRRNWGYCYVHCKANVMWSSKALQEEKGGEISCGLENVEGDNIWIRCRKMGKITGCFGKEEFSMSEKSIDNDCLRHWRWEKIYSGNWK